MKNIETYTTDIFLLLGFLFLGIFGNAQRIFNIEADYILLNNGELSFLKENNNTYYEIEIDINEFLENNNYIDTFNLSKDKLKRQKNNIIPISELNKVKPKKLINSIEEYKFIGNDFDYDNIILSKYNKNLFLLRYYMKNEEFYGADFCWYYFVIINKKYPIIILFNGDNEALAYVLPKQENVESFYYGTKLQRKKQTFDDRKLFSNNEKGLFSEFSFVKFYKREKIKDKFILVDKFSDTKILNQKFDKLNIYNDFIFAYKNGKRIIYIYNFKEIKEKKIQAFHYFSDISKRSLQIIQNNQLFWIDRFGNKTIKPVEINFSVCGNTSSYIKKIYIKNNSFFYIEKSDKDFDDIYESIDTTKLLLPSNIADVTFYNKTHTNYFYEEDMPITEMKLVLKDKNNKYSLGTAEKLKDEKSLCVKIQSLIDADSINFIEYGCPLKFYKNGLYGYYPQNKDAKYKTLEKFNYYFARFELPNGKKGWLDRKGNEYYDK